MKLARKLLRFKKDHVPQLRTREPPPSFLEADWPECFQGDQRLPAEVCYLLRSVRVLGHFEKPLFLELCRFMESRTIPAGMPLFCIGDQDDSIYVIQTGCVNVYMADHEGKDHLVKEVNKGECIHSLLSLHDVLTIIMVRLQRVTFMALYNYLGLSHELMNPTSPKGTPIKQSREGRHGSLPDAVTTSHSVGGDDEVTPAGGTKTGGFENAEGRKRSASLKRQMETTARVKPGPIGDSVAGPSDFDVVCTQARVTAIDDDASLMSTSPSKRATSQPVSVPTSANTKRGNKKAVLSDQVTFISSLNEPGMAGPTRRQHYLDDEELLELASKDIAKMFGLEDENLLFGKLYMRHMRAGMTLMKQGDQNTGLYFVVTGQLVVLQHTVGTDGTERTLFMAYPGNLVGALAVLTGEPSFFTIRAYSDVRLVYITKQDYYCLMKSHPAIVLHVSHTVVQRMSSFVRQIDFALDWSQLEAGRALFRQVVGDRADCIYIILNGRLRSVVTLKEGGKKEMVGEYGRGELVGLVEVITQTERATTMMAVRDTELAQIPDGLLNLIKRLHPQVVTRLIRLLGHKILGSLKNRPNPPAIYSALSGSTLILTSEVIQDKLGTSALDMMNEYRLSSWLNQQEDIHRMVLYQCDNRMTPWTQRCIRQADCLLVVALAEQEPTVGELEKQVENVAVLCVVVGEAGGECGCVVVGEAVGEAGGECGCVVVGEAAGEAGGECGCVVVGEAGGECGCVVVGEAVGEAGGECGCVVVGEAGGECGCVVVGEAGGECGCVVVGEAVVDSNCCHQVEMYRKLSQMPADRLTDFSRLARFLTGTIGSFIGALWAEERNLTTFTQRGREWSMVSDMS
ncbi:hypothetical protein NP493_298g00000 [Ridgeia piscesae]|uniref:lysophospholipase n=1 Tax=Ridgeia piscesae TaxID=27915 RepID=A0AAD9NV94_RIDPI|nr:hypothetical protein NP493_298g00000 [Ridgeia piscesae]